MWEVMDIVIVCCVVVFAVWLCFKGIKNLQEEIASDVPSFECQTYMGVYREKEEI